VSLLFLSTYSPDFNCIEYRWANMKRTLPDLVPKCETLQGAVCTYLTSLILKLFRYNIILDV
jgi:transposase